MRGLATLPLAVMLTACASVSLPEDAATFATATGAFTTSLKAGEAERLAALSETQRSVAEGAIAKGVSITFDAECWTRAKPTLDAFDKIAGRSYDSVRADKAFSAFRSITGCGLRPLVSPAAGVGSVLPVSKASDAAVIVGVGTDTLIDTASALDDYAAAVADVVANKSGAKRDEAANGLAGTLGKLLEAAGLKNAGAATGLASQLALSALAADRNATFGARLQQYDAVMPYIMERVGHAGRLTVNQAIANRLQAAQQRAGDANALLAEEASIGERARTFAAVAPGIDRQNDAIALLRNADPMIPARRFAEAHHALVEAYTGSRGQELAASAGLKAFSKAAGDLAEALSKE